MLNFILAVAVTGLGLFGVIAIYVFGVPFPKAGIGSATLFGVGCYWIWSDFVAGRNSG